MWHDFDQFKECEKEPEFEQMSEMLFSGFRIHSYNSWSS